LVDKTGCLRIIDLGFGKRVNTSVDFDKSVTLNWWCQTPSEFREGRYDFTTEVYFVGKLFERMILERNLNHFQVTSTLGSMCEYEAASRTSSFGDIQKKIQGRFFEIGFHQDEMRVYRAFAEAVSGHTVKIQAGAKYATDPEKIQNQLNDIYRRCMLEEFVPEPAIVLRCLVLGSFYFRNTGFPVGCLRDFVRLLRSSTVEKNRILIANLHSRLDALPRYTAAEDDDVPF